MKKSDSKRRKHPGRPPRWLALGTIAATTSLSGALATNAYAWIDHEKAVPPRRVEMPLIASVDDAEPPAADQTKEEMVYEETIEVKAPTEGPSSPKYTEPLRDTPQTITVIPSELIEQQGATTLREVLRNVTGISIQAGEGGGGLPGDNLSIRGFAARNDIFVDGVRDFGAYTRDPFNIEQVEVAKGPASLYSGRGSTGGAINLSSKAPLPGEARSATFGAGGDDFSRATIDFNQPLEDFAIPGTAVRVNAMWNQGDVPGRDVVTNERWGIAPSIAFGLGTPTRVTASFSRLDQDNIPEYGLPWVPNTNVPLQEHADQAPPVDFDNFYGLRDRDYEKTVTDLATVSVEHDFGDSISLRSLVRQGRSKRDSIITAPRFVGTDSTAINRQLQSRDLTDTILAQQNDLTFHFETGALGHALIAGTEVVREESENFARTGPAAPVADLFHPDPDAPYAGPITRTGARTESTADTVAIYANDTVKLGERWEITGGLRWDRFGIDYKSVAVDGAVTPFERTDAMLSWRAGVVFKPMPKGSVYASAGTSFNPASDGNTWDQSWRSGDRPRRRATDPGCGDRRLGPAHRSLDRLLRLHLARQRDREVEHRR
jgi:catecholate siderophore receptor